MYMNGYKAFYKGKEIEVHAESSYGAQKEAARLLGVPEKKRPAITVILCEKAGNQVTHNPAILG
jgi:hypothetical protein